MLREASLTNIDRTKMFEPNTANNNASFLEKGVLANTNYDQLCLNLERCTEKTQERKASLKTNKNFRVLYTVMEIWNLMDVLRC